MIKCPQFLEGVINLTTPCHTNERSVPGEEDWLTEDLSLWEVTVSLLGKTGHRECADVLEPVKLWKFSLFKIMWF